MSEFKIEKGVPMPNHGNGGREFPLPAALRKMEIGDSVLVVNRSRDSVVGTTAFIKRETGARFSTRVVDGGVRIWRVS
jgi:hypothetical protein